jgi:hypothetical protein
MALKGIFTPEEPRSGCLGGEEDDDSGFLGFYPHRCGKRMVIPDGG